MTSPGDIGAAGVTRRRLLQTGGIATAGAWIGVRASPATAADGSAGSVGAPAYLRRSSYTALGDRAFAATIAGQAAQLQLVEIGDLQDADQRGIVGADDAFVLTFDGPAGGRTEQGIHGLSNSQLGSFEIFIVPNGESQSTTRYVAVVDRSVGYTASMVPAATAPAAAAGPAAAGGGHPAHHVQQPTHHRGHASAVQRVSARRVAGGVACELQLAPSVHVTRLRAWLMKGDRTLGVASRRINGHHVHFEIPAHRLGKGPFDIVLTLIERGGAETNVRRCLPSL